MNTDITILGAGITGLSAGFGKDIQIFEAKDIAGGICASYYLGLDGRRTYARIDEETYRFEIGGGHWIFGADGDVLKFINDISPVKKYERRSGVYFPKMKLSVPYPLQNHLSYLPRDIIEKALKEVTKADHSWKVDTLADWLDLHFGKTLCGLFFYPFHELYTAGLFTKIAPQDQYKSPLDKNLIIKGASEKTLPVGYNLVFVYPEKGLDDLIRKMARKCRVNYNSEVIGIDLRRREFLVENGKRIAYKTLVSTLPLAKMLLLCGAEIGGMKPAYTSVLVMNIGAKKGINCPDDHWLYIPKSKSGFHRVGFYSNVDKSFLPASARKAGDRVSIYVEKSYVGGNKPSEDEIRKSCKDTVQELQEWAFIGEVDIIDTTWIETAYTWDYPGSSWKEDAISMLRQYGIEQAGRYGKWKFQGIADSIKGGAAYGQQHA